MKRADNTSDDRARPYGDETERAEQECPFAARLSAYYDEELAIGERAELDAHIAGCPACSEQLKDLRRLSELIEQVPSPALPDGFLERLHAGVGSARKQAMVRIAWPALAMAASLLIAFSVLLWQIPGTRARPGERGMTWEIAVASFKAEAPADVGPEELLTQLIARGLSGEGTHD